MKESIVKNIILVFMLIGKIAVLGWIMIHYSTHGLTKSETFSAISLVIPVFAVYLTVMVKDALATMYIDKRKKTERKVKYSILIIALIIFPLYVLLIMGAIGQTARGNFEEVDLQKAIGIIESAFGIYIGQLITTLFRAGDQK